MRSNAVTRSNTVMISKLSVAADRYQNFLKSSEAAERNQNLWSLFVAADRNQIFLRWQRQKMEHLGHGRTKSEYLLRSAQILLTQDTFDIQFGIHFLITCGTDTTNATGIDSTRTTTHSISRLSRYNTHDSRIATNATLIRIYAIIYAGSVLLVCFFIYAECISTLALRVGTYGRLNSICLRPVQQSAQEGVNSRDDDGGGPAIFHGSNIFFQNQGAKVIKCHDESFSCIGDAFLATIGGPPLDQAVKDRLSFRQGNRILQFSLALPTPAISSFDCWTIHISAKGGMMGHRSSSHGGYDTAGGDNSTSLTQTMSELNVSEKMLQDWIQDAVERQVELNLDIIAAKQMGQSNPTAIPQYRGENGWPGMEQLLSALAFDMDSRDCWGQLGLTPIEGANPTIESIHHRCGFVLFLMQGVDTGRWSMDDISKIDRAIGIIQKAKAECIEDLSNVRKTRKKARPQDVERWKELGDGPLTFLKSAFPDAMIALQLSKVLSIGPADQSMIPSEVARGTLMALSTGGAQAKDALARIGNQHWLTWAPEHNEALQRCLNAFVDYVKANGTGPTITLAVPFTKPPVGESFSAIIDVWTHKILQDKWSKITKQQVIIQDTMEIVRTGSAGPVVSKRSLLCVTLSPKPQDTIQKVVNWAPTFGKFNAGMAIIIDFQNSQLLGIQHLLSTYDGPIRISWGEPNRSTGSAPDLPRLCIHGFMPSNIHSSLEARVISSSLQEHLRSAPCLVGLANCYNDPEALKFEFTDAQAAVKFRHLFWDCLLISDKEALIRTEGTSENWQTELSRRMREDPGSCGLKVKWKPSVHGGRIWAQPVAIEAQIQAVRVQAAITCQGRAPGSKDQDFTSNIQIQGTLGPDPAGLIRKVMQSLNEKLGAALTEQATEERLEKGRWQLLKVEGTDVPSGRIRVMLSNKPEVIGMQRAYHGATIQVGELSATLHISNPILAELPPCIDVGGASFVATRGAPGL